MEERKNTSLSTPGCICDRLGRAMMPPCFPSPVIPKSCDFGIDLNIPHRTITTNVVTLLEEVAAGKALYWAICLGREGRVIGTCDLSEIDEHHRRAEIRFMVAREYWGKGYAFEAMHTVIEYAVRSMDIEAAHCTRAYGK
jgi:RimJ/RimL family protein N-acetyltransferase